jgi:mRNA interferase MazF
MVKPRQGDVYWVSFGKFEDSGPSGKRPAIVVQNDLLNQSNINTTIVVLLTSNLKLANVPGNILLKKGWANLPKTSVVVVTQITTIDKSRLIEKIGKLTNELTETISKACQEIIRTISQS